jgi:hypothetical protein
MSQYEYLLHKPVKIFILFENVNMYFSVRKLESNPKIKTLIVNK